MTKLSPNEVLFANTLSKLRRATGIPNCPDSPDAYQRGYCFAYTHDRESADILANLAAQALMAIDRHTERYWSKQHFGDAAGLHGGITIEQEHDNLYMVRFFVPEVVLEDFAKKIDQKIELLIAPDKLPRNSRSR